MKYSMIIISAAITLGAISQPDHNLQAKRLILLEALAESENRDLDRSRLTWRLAEKKSDFVRGCDEWSSDLSTLEFESSQDWILPVEGVISAGTWEYDSGDLHLGLDIAAGMYTEVLAPANGIILYARAASEDNGGYFGNMEGWPFGGGNTIAMLCSVNDKLYAVTFAHLSSQIMVSPGMSVMQGDIIALSGNSGNSTGPHTHIEVFEIYEELQDAVNRFTKASDFSFSTGWDEPASCNMNACRIRPEKVFSYQDDE